MYGTVAVLRQEYGKKIRSGFVTDLTLNDYRGFPEKNKRKISTPKISVLKRFLTKLQRFGFVPRGKINRTSDRLIGGV